MESLLLAHVTGGLHAAVALLALTVVAVGVGAGWGSSPGLRRRTLLTVVVGGMAFQVLHSVEHFGQLGYWFSHPGSHPWLTPWAVEGRDVLAVWADGRPDSGTELLHFLGNAVFLLALFAAHRVPDVPWSTAPRARHLRIATWFQSVHVVEHALLTSTWLLVDRTLGASTLFGLLGAGAPATNTIRVWVHFGMNATATIFALRAGLLLLPRRTWRPRRGRVPAAGRLPA